MENTDLSAVIDIHGDSVMIIEPTGDKFGHYDVFTSCLAAAFGRRGVHTTIWTNALPSRENLQDFGNIVVEEYRSGRLEFIEEIDGRRIPSWKYWYQYFRNSFFVTISGLRKAATKKIRYVYISDAEFLMATLALFLAVRPSSLKILMQVNAANFTFSTYSGGLAKKSYKALQAKFFRLALLHRISGIAVLGETLGDRLRSQLKLPPEYPIEVIPDGADTNMKAIEKAAARTELGVPLDQRLFLMFGNIRKDKDFKCALAAFSKIRRDFGFIWVGHIAEYDRGEVEGWLDEYSAGSRLVFSHFSFADSDLVRLVFSAADGLLLPYTANYSGGSGVLRKEAASFSRPVIVSDVAEMGSLVRKHDLGLTYQAEDSDDLARAIGEFLEKDEETYRKWGKNCRQLGAVNSWDSMAKKMWTFFAVR